MNVDRRPIKLLLEFVLIVVGLALLHCSDDPAPAQTSTPDAASTARPDVVAPPGATAVSITLTPTNATLSPGDTVSFTAVVGWSDGSSTDVSSYGTFSSSDPSVLSIGAGGRATAVKAGTATVSASAEGQSITTSVTVTEATVVGLTLNVAAVVLSPGGTQQLAATATFSDGSTRDVTQSATFSSSNTSVAEVSTTGLVVARARGGATVTATYGLRSAAASVTVTDPAIVALQVTPPAASLTVGSTTNFAATALYADGSTRVVTAESAWVSGDAGIATINASGFVTARAPGSVTITATHDGKVGTAAVIVQAPRVVALAVSPANSTVTKADELQFAAVATLSDGYVGNVTSSATWSSDDTSVGTVDPTGKFTAIKVGATQVRATYGGITSYTGVTVVAPSVVSISVSPSVATVGVGATVALTATARLDNGTTRNVTSECQWTSMATSVATVASGTVTGAGAGSTTITCTLQGRSAQATVTVTESTPVTPLYRRIFVTATPTTGALDGTDSGAIAAADAICAMDAEKPSGGGTYKALLVNSARKACTTYNCSGGAAEHLDWVLAPSTEYRRADGTTIIGTTNSDGLFTFPLVNALDDGPVDIWTGLMAGWQVGMNCTQWMGAFGMGSAGIADQLGDSAFWGGFPFCNTTINFYCVEQ